VEISAIIRSKNLAGFFEKISWPRRQGSIFDLLPEVGSMSEISVVMITAGNAEEAAKIGRTLVEERLAACANIVPGVRSIYRWKGQICDEQELLIIAKTRTSLFPALEKRVKELHSYEVPEIISFPVARGLPQYLEWVRQEAGSGKREAGSE
jgi:periplasmic divalent cation tolerance protein